MTKHEITLRIPKADEKLIEKLLGEPSSEDEWTGSGVLLGYGIKFKDGCYIDIDICGTDHYENGSSNSAWVQAVLFDPYGRELACPDISDDIYGDWELECNECLYVVHVKHGK